MCFKKPVDLMAFCPFTVISDCCCLIIFFMLLRASSVAGFKGGRILFLGRRGSLKYVGRGLIIIMTLMPR